MERADGRTVPEEVPLFHWRSYRLYLLLLLMGVFTVTSCNYMHMGITLTCMVNASTYERPSIVKSQQCPSLDVKSEELGYTVCRESVNRV